MTDELKNSSISTELFNQLVEKYEDKMLEMGAQQFPTQKSTAPALG